MKRLMIILCILLVSAGAFGQNHHHRDDRHRDSRHRTENVRHSRHHHRHDDRRNDRKGREHHHTVRYNIPDEVACVYDWQELWNGCHVRLLHDWVYIVDRNGDNVVRGNRVYLASNGSYEVKMGDIWRVYDRNGDFTTISGWDIFYWSEGFYGVKIGDFWRLYDEDGDSVGNIWGEHVALLDNHTIRCTRNGRDYYYDWNGNEVR